MATDETTRSVKIKFSARAANAGALAAACTLAHPSARPGINHDASIQITEITEVPARVSDQEVIRLWNGTADCTWLGKIASGGEGRHVFRFSELGMGRLIFD